MYRRVLLYPKMSRKIIAELELALEKVLVKYETEYEITTAEVVGILEILKSGRIMKAVMSHNVEEFKELLGVACLSEVGAPVGDIITLEGNGSGDE